MDEEQFKKIATTITLLLPMLICVVFLLWVLCFSVQKVREVLEAESGYRERQLRQSSQAGGWENRAPSSTVAGGDVEVAPPVRAAEPPLVCTYRKADGWQEGSSCGVCLADLDDGEAVRVLPACMHYFHATCVGKWLRAHATCPLCRAPLVAPADATTT